MVCYYCFWIILFYLFILIILLICAKKLRINGSNTTDATPSISYPGAYIYPAWAIDQANDLWLYGGYTGILQERGRRRGERRMLYLIYCTVKDSYSGDLWRLSVASLQWEHVYVENKLSGNAGMGIKSYATMWVTTYPLSPSPQPPLSRNWVDKGK
jgi:hypothetical protein